MKAKIHDETGIPIMEMCVCTHGPGDGGQGLCMPRWTLADYHVQDGATLYLRFDGDGSSDAYIPVAGQVYDETKEGTESSCEEEMQIFVTFDTLEP
eukprot:7519666-Heterocapsa_arctica.AAC.1